MPGRTARVTREDGLGTWEGSATYPIHWCSRSVLTVSAHRTSGLESANSGVAACINWLVVLFPATDGWARPRVTVTP